MGKSTARIAARMAKQEEQWLGMKPFLDRYLALTELEQIEDPGQLPRYLAHPNQEVRDEAARKLHEFTELSRKDAEKTKTS